MLQEYSEARKLAKMAEKLAFKYGHSPYLPVLDELEEAKNTAGEPVADLGR